MSYLLVAISILAALLLVNFLLLKFSCNDPDSKKEPEKPVSRMHLKQKQAGFSRTSLSVADE